MRSRLSWPRAQGLAAGLALMLSAPALAADTAFPRFSPLQSFADADLREGSPLQLPFGAGLAVEEVAGRAVRVKLESGATAWLRRADVFIGADGAVVASGPQFATTNRPTVRFWRDHGTLVDFLSRSRAMEFEADFEEVLVRDPDFPVRLPLVSEDVVDMIGDRSARVAQVMLPIHGSTARNLAAAAGTGGYELHVVADVSGDAAPFTRETLVRIVDALERPLREHPHEIKVSLTLFGNNVATGGKRLPAMEWSRLKSGFDAPPDGSLTHAEPLLQAMAANPPTAGAGRAGAAYIVLAGGDIQPQERAPAPGGETAFDTLRLDIPADTLLLLAKVTPEPGDDLRRLAEHLKDFGKTEYIDFSSSLGARIGERIAAALHPDVSRPLGEAALARICREANDSGQLCVLPVAPTAASRLPEPPKREDDPDWYSIVVWLVVDGLNLVLKP